jgi:hypothetical protein
MQNNQIPKNDHNLLAILQNVVPTTQLKIYKNPNWEGMVVKNQSKAILYNQFIMGLLNEPRKMTKKT